MPTFLKVSIHLVKKQDDVHLGRFYLIPTRIGMAFEYCTIWKLDNFHHLNTGSPVFRYSQNVPFANAIQDSDHFQSALVLIIGILHDISGIWIPTFSIISSLHS